MKSAYLMGIVIVSTRSTTSANHVICDRPDVTSSDRVVQLSPSIGNELAMVTRQSSSRPQR